MHPLAKEVYKAVYTAHAEAYAKLKKMHDVVGSCSDVKEQADFAYALRETAKLADDLRKMADATRSIAEKICCAVAVKDGITDPVRTEYCTATPRIKMSATLPNKRTDPERYAQLLEFFGMTDEAREMDVARINWNGFVDYVTRACEEGRPLPPGVDMEKTYPVYSLSPLRRKKGVLEES